MKDSIMKISAITLAALLAGGAASAVSARGGCGHGWDGMRGGGECAQMKAGVPVEQRLAEAKSRLGVSAEQEAAWNDYAAAVTAKAALRASHRAQARSADAPDYGQRLVFRKQGLEQMQALVVAEQQLYAQLTAEQKSRYQPVYGRHMRGMDSGRRCSLRN